MKFFSRWAVCLVLLLPAVWLRGEKVANLPAPTSYVSDVAGVLDGSTLQSVNDLCQEVDRQAHAQIAVVTIKTLDGGQSIEEFATELEDKWKVGTKGTDRGVLMVFVISPTRGRIEVGYGLEGILNDAKVGDIGRAMVPSAQQGDYNQAIPLGVQKIANVIAADAGVVLTPIVHTYHHQQQVAVTPISFEQVLIVGAVVLFILFILVRTGNTGILFFILGNLMGGGGFGGNGGRGRDDRGEGGGFGGFDGGGSGGGGASGDF